MKNYVRKLFGVMFQSQPTRQNIRINQQQLAPKSPAQWSEYWQAHGQPWRTEPEIDAKRQEELNRHRAIIPDVEQGIYPFKGVKLSRADVEWLLATHEHGRGPVSWSDESQRGRRGLDLRGAHLQKVDLNDLPLARLKAGLVDQEWYDANEEQRAQASICLQGASLRKTQLEGASLSEAQLEEADLYRAQLEDADLGQAQLRKANFYRAELLATNLGGAKLQGAILRGADLAGTHLAGVILSDERRVGPQLADVQWGTNLARVDWSQVMILGDEDVARQKKDEDGKLKSGREILRDHQVAVRANRQLAVALQAQGLNEDAARFAYRAQILQRKVFWKQQQFGKWLFSSLLALLAGYGYRMWRILVAYLIIVLLCAVAYFVLGMYYEPHLSFLEAVLTSVTAFHGRVFSEPFLRPGEPQQWVTAFEAIAGLVIEGVFIAMLTQKFFGK